MRGQSFFSSCYFWMRDLRRLRRLQSYEVSELLSERRASLAPAVMKISGMAELPR
jgi:hypothetical protein